MKVISSTHFKIKARNSKKFQCTLNKMGCALNSIYGINLYIFVKFFCFMNPNVSMNFSSAFVCKKTKFQKYWRQQILWPRVNTILHPIFLAGLSFSLHCNVEFGILCFHARALIEVPTCWYSNRAFSTAESAYVFFGIGL